MRIAFVSPNREQLPDPVVPLGLLYVMANTPVRHDRLLIDLCFEKRPLEHLSDRLKRFAPDLVALSLRNIQTNDYSGIANNLRYYRSVMECIRACSEAPVVVGGGGFSVMPERLMVRLRPDYGIPGEGERTFPELLQRLEEQAGLDRVPGLQRFEDGELVVNPPALEFQELDGLRRPVRADADPRYYEKSGIDSLQTRRGCPLHCTYCTYPVIEGRQVRCRDPTHVVDELFEIVELHPQTKHVFIVDSVFNLPPEHAKAVCREMIARDWELPWTAYANPLGFDDELARLMAEAHCAGLEIGSDSGVDAVLQRLHKGFDTAQIVAMHETCKSAGVPDCHTFLLGSQGESMEDLRRTLAFIRELQPFASILMIWKDDYESLEPGLAESRRVLRERILELLDRLSSRNPTWIVPALGFNFGTDLFDTLRRNHGFSGPLWQHIQLGAAATLSRDSHAPGLRRTSA